jgi:hypothetical protein
MLEASRSLDAVFETWNDEQDFLSSGHVPGTA